MSLRWGRSLGSHRPPGEWVPALQLPAPHGEEGGTLGKAPCWQGEEGSPWQALAHQSL